MTEQLRSIRRKVVVEKERLKRTLGVAALFATGYGNVGSSIYYALGATAVYALGATPLALFIAGLFFFLTILTFSEAATIMPYAGGSAFFARKAFNESISFITGWVDLLAYVATIAISSITAAYYLKFFIPFISKPIPISIGDSHFYTNPNFFAILVAIIFVVILMAVNIIGIKEATTFNIIFAIIDILTQGLIIIIGFLIFVNFEKIIQYYSMGPKYWPDLKNFIFGIAIAMVSYTGIETIAQMAEETENYKVKIPKSYIWMAVVVIVMSISMPLVAISAMEPPVLVNNWHTEAVAGIAYFMPDVNILGHVIKLKVIIGAWVSFLAFTILLMATNAGIIGASRLSYSMGQFRQIPDFLFKLHRKYNTPHISIIFFSFIAIGLLISGIFIKDIFLKLANLYSLSSVFIFAIAHISVIALRIKNPEMERPFKIKGNIKIRGREIPLTAVIGFLVNFIVLIVLLFGQVWTKIVVAIWLSGGYFFYLIYRKKHKLPIHEEVMIERVVEAAYQPIDFYEIIVPTKGELDASMIQTACKIALRDKSKILAIYIIEVPMTLPVDASLPVEKEKGEKALDQAEIIAKEYGVSIETKLIQARSAGKAIVDEAIKRKADLILLGQSEKSKAIDILSGKTVDYVSKNAPCKVLINISEKK
jgi:APA family basic amino acid/polyamine antiporter